MKYLKKGRCCVLLAGWFFFLPFGEDAWAKGFFERDESLSLATAVGSGFFITTLSARRHFSIHDEDTNPFQSKQRDDVAASVPVQKLPLAWDLSYGLSQVSASNTVDWGHSFSAGLSWREEDSLQFEFGLGTQNLPSEFYRRGALEMFLGYEIGKARFGLQFDFFRHFKSSASSPTETLLNAVEWGPQIEWRFRRGLDFLFNLFFHRYDGSVDAFLAKLDLGVSIRKPAMALTAFHGIRPEIFYFPNLRLNQGVQVSWDEGSWKGIFILSQTTYAPSFSGLTFGVSPWISRKLGEKLGIGAGVELVLGGTQTVFAGSVGLSYQL